MQIASQVRRKTREKMHRCLFLICAGFLVACTFHELMRVSLSTDGDRELRAYSDAPYMLETNGATLIQNTPTLLKLEGNGEIKNAPQELIHEQVVPQYWNPCELKDTNRSEITKSAPKSYMLSNKTAIFLHPGKSGGGTFTERTVQCWRTFMTTCHPHPCKKKADLQSKIVITIRDPIERFVSAFYWRTMIVCDRRDKRKFHRGATKDPERFCKRPLPGELKAIRSYSKDASRLADSLCSPIESVRIRAEKSLRKIEHAKVDLLQWLNFSWHADDLFPIVNEKGITNLEKETDAAVHWIYDRENFEGDHDFQLRSNYADRRRVKGDLVHTSSSLKRRLTSRAEQCLMNYFEKDYEILMEIEQNACKTKGCHEGLQSILERRRLLQKEIT